MGRKPGRQKSETAAESTQAVAVQERKTLVSVSVVVQENKCPHCGNGGGHECYGSHVDQLGRRIANYQCVSGCGMRFKIIKKVA